MISSSIYSDAIDTGNYPEGIQKAIKYLKETDFSSVPVGRYDIDGDNIYALVQEAETVPVEKKRPESHKKYADVQFLVSGIEKYGFAPDTGNLEIADGNEANDIYFYSQCPNESFLIAEPGCYNVFFPGDIHRPGCAVSDSVKIKKVVVKVKV